MWASPLRNRKECAYTGADRVVRPYDVRQGAVRNGTARPSYPKGICSAALHGRTAYSYKQTKGQRPGGALSLYMRVLPLQVLFRLLAEHVGHVAAEDQVHLAAHGEMGGVAVGGDDDHYVVAMG